MVLHKRYGPAADVWSLGVVLHILLVGRSPWQQHQQHQQHLPPGQASDSIDDGSTASTSDCSGSGSGDPHRAILARSVRGKYSTEGAEWAGVSEGAKDLVARMLVVDDAQRITTAEALEHPWLAAAAAPASASSKAAAPAGRNAAATRTPPPLQQRRRGRQPSSGRGREAEAGAEGEGDAEWVHTPGEAAGPLRSLLDAAWCRGSSFLAHFSPAGSGGSRGGVGKSPSVTHSGSGTDTTSSSISSSA